MTTREIYFKILMSTDIPMGHAYYATTDLWGKYEIDSIPIELKTDDVTSSKYIKIMEEIEKKPGFKFWLKSPEGEVFLKQLKWAKV